MASVWICDECQGAGVHGYASGPAVERCPRCQGGGVLFGEPGAAVHDLLGTVFAGRGAELQMMLGEGGLVRALAGACAVLEARVNDLEHEVARLRQ